jgi:hypothetical protein
MRFPKLVLPLFLLLAAAPARAQISLHIDLGLPVAPPLVLVAPGIQVVEGFGEEVFFRGGWYWCRRESGWYRARSPRARFDFIEPRFVPMELVHIPAGHYRNWRHDVDRPHEPWRGESRRAHERNEIRREERHEMRREERREDRHEDRRENRRDERHDERRDERREH